MAFTQNLDRLIYGNLLLELYRMTTKKVYDEFFSHAKERKLPLFTGDWPREVMSEALNQLQAANRAAREEAKR